MATLNITLPDDLRDLIEARVSAGIYPDVDSYVSNLIRSDILPATDDALADALEEGEASGWSDKTFDEIVAEERARFRAS